MANPILSKAWALAEGPGDEKTGHQRRPRGLFRPVCLLTMALGGLPNSLNSAAKPLSFPNFYRNMYHFLIEKYHYLRTKKWFRAMRWGKDSKDSMGHSFPETGAQGIKWEVAVKGLGSEPQSRDGTPCGSKGKGPLRSQVGLRG